MTADRTPPARPDASAAAEHIIAPHPILQDATFVFATTGDGASAVLLHGWSALVAQVEEEVACGEGDRWRDFLADLDDWSPDGDDAPYRYSFIFEDGSFGIYRLAAAGSTGQQPAGEPVAYHRDDEGPGATEAYALLLARLDDAGRRKLANLVSHGARAVLAPDGAVVLSRKDWTDIKILRAAPTTQALPAAVPAEPQPTASLFDLSASDIRLMAGEMTAQEMRTVKAVLAGLKARAAAPQAPAPLPGSQAALLTPDEIDCVVRDLTAIGHGPDGNDYEPECPACTAVAKLAASPSGGMVQAQVDAAPIAVEPMHMTLCEFGKLVPRPGQTYIGVHITGCEECDRLASEQREAYGRSSPTVNEDGSLAASSFPAAPKEGA